MNEQAVWMEVTLCELTTDEFHKRHLLLVDVSLTLSVLDILSRREWSAAARIWINLSLASVEQLLGWLLSLFCSAKSGGTGIARSVFYCSPLMLNRQMSCIFHNKIHVIWEMALLGVHSGNNCAAVQDSKRTPNGVNVTPVYSK